MAWIEDIALERPAVLALVAQVPLEKGLVALEATMGHPLVSGVRRNVQDEAPGFMLTPGFVAGVGGLGTLGLPFDACVREHQLRELGRLVERNPGVTFVLDHLGKPDVRRRRREPWFRDLAALALHPNVFAKLSGLTTEADWQDWQPADVLPYLRHAIDVFGPERCMYGSDWPVATLATTYARWVDVVREAVADLPLREQTAVLIGTAERVYQSRAQAPVHPRS
jgi:L-fuconolactonase